MTQNDQEDFENNNIRRFCEKEILDNKVREHFDLTEKYRSAAHGECIINVKQSQNNFFSVILHDFSNHDCQLFFSKC